MDRDDDEEVDVSEPESVATRLDILHDPEESPSPIHEQRNDGTDLDAVATALLNSPQKCIKLFSDKILSQFELIGQA